VLTCASWHANAPESDHGKGTLNPTEIPVPAGVQHLVDRVIDGLQGHRSLVQHPDLEQLGDWLNDNEEAMNDIVCSQENWIHAPYLDDVIDRAWEEHEEADSPALAYAAVAAVLDRALDGDEHFWGDEYWVPICGTLRHSDGRTCILRLSLRDYLSGPYDWDGVYLDMTALLDALAEEGRVGNMEQLRERRGEVLDMWQARRRPTGLI
jgi:hypothetical protein